MRAKANDPDFPTHLYQSAGFRIAQLLDLHTPVETTALACKSFDDGIDSPGRRGALSQVGMNVRL